MHAADAGEGGHVGLAPSRQGGRPLAGATESVHSLAGLDDRAIHQPRHEQRQLARGRGDHDLVEERQSFLNASLQDQYAALLVPGAGNEVGVAASPADLSGPHRACVRRLQARQWRSAAPPLE